jgi:transposase
MALCPNFQVELPKRGIIVAKSGKYPYVYHVDSTYRNQKGMPDNKKRSIGKLDKTTGMLIPNKTYFDIYEPKASEELPQQNVTQMPQREDELSYGEVREIGVVAVIQAIFENLGIRKILVDIFGDHQCQTILTLVAYMLVEGNTIQYIDDFCENTLFGGRLTDQRVSELFASLSNAKRMAFFKEWIGINIQKEYIAYDVTSFSTYARNIDDASYGYNRDNESIPQINLALYMGQTSLLPMFYVTYDGSIVDKSHLQYMMAYNAELDIENVSFVMDKGFATTDNAEFMRFKGYTFILGAEYRIKAIQQAFAENKQKVQDAKNYILREKVYGLPVKGRFYRIAATLHIFYDPEAVPKQTADFFRKIVVEENELSQLKELDDEQAKKYARHFVITKPTLTTSGLEMTEGKKFAFERDNLKINEIRERFGYFFILTNKDLMPEDVVSTYRKRDVIEKGFDEIKNGLDMKRLRTHYSSTADGKMFCAFIGLICRLHIQNKLRELMDNTNASNERVIRELSKIRAIKVNPIHAKDDGKIRLLNPLTKTQKDILTALGFKTDIISDYIHTLNLYVHKKSGV